MSNEHLETAQTIPCPPPAPPPAGTIAANLPQLARAIRELLTRQEAATDPEAALGVLAESRLVLEIAANTIEQSRLKPLGEPGIAALVEELRKAVDTGETIAVAWAEVRADGNVQLFHSGSHFTALRGGLTALDDLLGQKVLRMSDHDENRPVEERMTLVEKNLGELLTLLRETSKRLDKIKGI